MNFLRLSDPLLSVLFEDEDIIAVDKPYGFNTHTNDSKIDHSEFIEEGLIEMLEKQGGARLHIIHRLDQTTTGVIVFGKSVESAKKYAEYFFNRQVKKTYLFITAAKSTAPEFSIDQAIVHKGKDLEAKTTLQFLKRCKLYELWQANPHTGRNHQIRIHAKAAGLSILGDPKYGGRDFAFLCLHNRRIEFPNGIIVESEAPAYFENLHYLEDPILSDILFETDRRLRLFGKKTLQSDQSFKLSQGKVIDHLGDRLVLHWPKESMNEAEQKRFTTYAELLGKPIMVRSPKGITSLNSPKGFLDNHWLTKEGDLSFQLKADSTFLGVTPNLRLQRNWLQSNSQGKSVLVLFAQTCAYSVHAAKGGASEVTSIETNKNLLNWGRANFELNQLQTDAPDKFKFFCRESHVFLKQCLSKGSKFDLILCETPSFQRGEKGVFKIESDLQSLLENGFQCLNKNGQMLFSTTHDSFFVDDLRKLILKAAKVAEQNGMPLKKLSSIQAAFDFELPYEKAQLKSFLIEF